MTGAGTLRGVLGAAVLAAASATCLSSPPGHLPSSVRLLYSRATEDSLGSRTDIYFLVARSENELRLTDESGVDRQPVFVPGLRKVYFTRETSGREEIWSMELDGSDEQRVLGGGGESVRDPAVSPDERRLAFTRVVNGRPRVEVADVDGSDAQVLIAEGTWRQPAWSPDGRTLAVVGEQGGSTRIFLVDAAGGPSRPASGAGGTQADPDWSPDGRRIAFTLGTGRDAEIAVLEVAGGGVTSLTDNDSEDTSPAWSTTGERIIFVSRRPNDRNNLWVMDADGSDVTSLTRSEESSAADPDWL